MIHKSIFNAVLALSLAAFAAGANAAVVSFNENNNWTKGALSFTGSDGTTVTAQGSLYDDKRTDPLFYGDPYISSWAGSFGGIGICSGDKKVKTNTNSISSCNDNHQVDGKGSNEAVILNFVGRQVNLLSATFAYVSRNDDYEVFMGNGGGYNLGMSLPNNCWTCTVSNFSVGSDSSFAFGAYHKNDDWKLQALEYEIIPTPLPATGWLMMAGIGALGFARRRKTRPSLR
ncbi:VPLPA-CTERM sorting domain-containing protein [Sulfitobacter sp. F26169L]|uniref:VPLPA-CTERM sorting domain-containing protein n=1 Tax=Sulfitobacter sp. F26169L TaxID=2996015 RepID=UPI002260906B|nr:VPLPA-CTERM sorting domain-containing protein [Sulfitobacter sp. F26169L]MCX7567503.1 VPLPA-CTERM sorting domain-containing protein [Sulfitobacter sp. F26169L]